jgi:3-methylfumaryl-CoA hydratase
MWAGGDVSFHRPIPLGAALERVSTVEDVTARTGASGEMVFVTVRHTISADGERAIEERQDIVYRGPAAPGRAAPAAHGEAREPDVSREHLAGPVALFRFSALTFNSHRIHFDRDYARGEEGYPGLVVQGPFIATLLMDLYLRERPGAAVRDFAFRARAPLFDVAPFILNLARADGGVELWAADAAGRVAMTARIEGE